MFFSRVRRLEPELCSDLCARGWRAGAGDCALDQVQNLLLTGGEFGLVDHGSLLFRYPVPVFLTSFRSFGKPWPITTVKASAA
jgi:hypothetical protein